VKDADYCRRDTKSPLWIGTFFVNPAVLFRHLGRVSCANGAFCRTHILACLLACFVFTPATLAQKVKVEFDPEADFSSIRQYEWRSHPVFVKHPELKETYATGIQLVLEEGNTQLMKRGFQPADSAPPDIYVTFFLHGQGVTVTTVRADPGYGWYAPPIWITETDNRLDGTLVIDIVDARSSKLLWRAYCGDQIKDMRKRDKNITAAVRKAFERFPPKK
jgi:hypothetical protein